MKQSNTASAIEKNFDQKQNRRNSPLVIFLMLAVAGLLLFTLNFVWKIIQNTQSTSTVQAASISGSPVSNSNFSQSNALLDLLWQPDSKAVDLDEYIAANQVSQNIIDKKQRVMLEPELIDFTAAVQSQIKTTQAELVADALSVWGISPLPEVAFSLYLRSPNGEVIGVYVENTVAKYMQKNTKIDSDNAFQAYRLYNYAKGPRLLLVGVKEMSANTDANKKMQISEKG